MKRERNAAKAPVDTGPIIAAGDQARSLGRWDIAIEHYGRALAIDPANAGVRVQLGHGLKELGRLAEAETAYRLAASVRPDDADVHVQIGHVLKLQGLQEQAVEAYAEALRRNPAFEPARTELIAAGKRNLLPDALYGRSAITDALTRLSATARSGQAAMGDLDRVSIFPIEAYDAFRNAFPIQPPPPSAASMDRVLIIIDAAEAHPALIRLTLISLLDQAVVNWTAIVLARDGVANHSVASLAEQDSRISFAASIEGVLRRVAGFDGSLLLCAAGADFDVWALSWFTMAQARTNADLVFCDHDHHISHWRTGRAYGDPVFQSMPDVWDMAGTPSPPVAVLVGASWRDRATAALSRDRGEVLRRDLLVSALQGGGRLAHIPRLLCSMRVEGLDGPAPLSPSIRPGGGMVDGEVPLIRVIIPTRDQPEILKACIDTLLSNAAKPDRLRLQIIDNRSSSRETLDLLRTLEREGRAQVNRFDEAFNWARINNVAAAGATGDDILVFANNDVEMLTHDWDQRLVDTLAVAGVGAVGVRLLYPDRTVQHAGMVLGVNDLRPVHDGLSRSSREGGPTDRWRRPRQVAAVTGAFMAVRRGVFEQVGGFDERLAIGYNDVDLCLRIRAEGLSVVYDPAIELIHHESKTRGLQDNRAKVAWDDEELTDLHARWGGWMMFDPGQNPHWFSTGTRPCDGLRDVRRSEVMRHIDLSARLSPWSIDQKVDPFDANGR